MYAHLQRVSLSFMDKTEVGRLMSRLQGDVHALQEFLETSVFAIGDFVLLVGITIVLLALDWRLGLLTLSVVPILLVVRIVWLPRARRAFLRARLTSSTLNGALAEGIHGVRTVQGMGREAVNLQLFEDKVADNLDAQLRGTWLAQLMVPIVDTLTGAAMAIVVVVGGIAVLEGRARPRRDGRVPVLRPALLRPDPLAHHAVQHHAARHGVGAAHLRGAGRADRGPGQARRARRPRASTARSSSAT